MSHFTVLVIGDDPEAQLAPYHEFECTGENDEYVQDVDQTEEVQAQIDEDGLTEGLSYFGLEDAVVEDESEIDIEGAHKYGYAVVVDEKLVKAVKRTNPDARWDWYQMGGRWSGFFLSKGGGKLGSKSWANAEEKTSKNQVDQLYKADLDIEGMRGKARQEAEQAFQRVQDALNGLPMPQHWNEFRKNFDNMDDAREAYGQIPSVIALREAKLMPFFADINDVYGTDREAFVTRQVNGALAPYAIIKDGNWYAQGEMGWWGISSNEMSADDWNAKVNEMLDSIPDDTLLSLYDCHI